MRELFLILILGLIITFSLFAGDFIARWICSKLKGQKEEGDRKWIKLIIISYVSTVLIYASTIGARPCPRMPDFTGLLVLLFLSLYIDILIALILFSDNTLKTRIKYGITGFFLFPYTMLIIYIIVSLFNFLYINDLT